MSDDRRIRGFTIKLKRLSVLSECFMLEGQIFILFSNEMK